MEELISLTLKLLAHGIDIRPALMCHMMLSVR